MFSVLFKANGKSRDIKRSCINETIFVLMLLQISLSSTVVSLKQFQAPVETVLLILFVYGVSLLKLSKPQILLLFTLLIVTILSFITSDSFGIITTAKNNFLGILAFIYFTHVPFRSKLIIPTFLFDLFITLLAPLIPSLLEFFLTLTSQVEYNSSRFGGIFFNTHFNAFFLAIIFIHLTRSVSLYSIAGGFVLYQTGSKTMFFSFVSQILLMYYNLLPIWFKFITKFNYLRITFSAFPVLIFVFFLLNYTFYLNLYFDNYATLELGSLSVILYQLSDPSYYFQFLHFLPIKPEAYNLNVINNISSLGLGLDHDGSNEIGFVALFHSCGFLLAPQYLIQLLARSAPYFLFILFSLLHYNYILCPAAVYLIVEFSRVSQSDLKLGKNSASSPSWLS